MNTQEKLRNKVVVVAGASAGVGRAVAREFAKYNMKVALLARGMKALKATAAEVEAAGSEALIISVDLADNEAVENAAQKIQDTWNVIDIWVNNAMVSVFAPFTKVEPEDFKRVTELTYLGQVNGTRAALKRMIPRDKGEIILVGSALAFRGIPLQSAYCGSKHAIQGFFDSLRSELIHDGSNINLSMVQLPAMNTTQFGWVKTFFDRKPQPMGKIYQPEVAARAITYLATNKRRSVWVGFSTLQTILGNKVAPGFLDHFLAKGGYQGQLTDKKEDANRKHNLYEPVDEDRGAHGDFDDRAADTSSQLWLSKNKKEIGIAAGALLLIAGLYKALE